MHLTHKKGISIE